MFGSVRLLKAATLARVHAADDRTPLAAALDVMLPRLVMITGARRKR
jgi:hypothetical protein